MATGGEMTQEELGTVAAQFGCEADLEATRKLIAELGLKF